MIIFTYVPVDTIKLYIMENYDLKKIFKALLSINYKSHFPTSHVTHTLMCETSHMCTWHICARKAFSKDYD